MRHSIAAFLLILLLSGTYNAKAQNRLTESVDKLLPYGKSVTFKISYGGNDLYSSEDIEGGPSYTGRGFYSIEAEMAFRITDNLDIVPGISFIGNSFDVSPAYRPTLSDRQSLNVFSIPVYVRYHFFKYLFVSGGPTFNANGGDRDLNGIGAGLHLGGEFKLSNGLLVTFGPFIRYQGILPWKSYKLANRGVTFGVGYRF